MVSAPEFIKKKLQQRQVILISKTVCAECDRVKTMLNSTRLLTPDMYEVVDIDKRGDCSQVQDFLWGWTDLCTKTVPLLFVNGVYFGGYDRILGLYEERRLKKELISKLDEVKIKTDLLAVSNQEEVVVTFEEIDQTEIRVEIWELDEGVDLDDGEVNCSQVVWAFDPWKFDDDYDVTAAVKNMVSSRGSILMGQDTDELKAMRRSTLRADVPPKR